MLWGVYTLSESGSVQPTRLHVAEYQILDYVMTLHLGIAGGINAELQLWKLCHLFYHITCECADEWNARISKLGSCSNVVDFTLDFEQLTISSAAGIYYDIVVNFSGKAYREQVVYKKLKIGVRYLHDDRTL